MAAIINLLSHKVHRSVSEGKRSKTQLKCVLKQGLTIWTFFQFSLTLNKQLHRSVCSPHNNTIRSDDYNLSPLFLSVFLVRKCLDEYSSHIRVLQWKCCQWKLLFSSFAKKSCLFNVKFYSVLNIKITRRQEHSSCNTSYIFYDN